MELIQNDLLGGVTKPINFIFFIICNYSYFFQVNYNFVYKKIITNDF